MKHPYLCAGLLIALPLLAGQSADMPKTMTKVVVRLMGPGIKPGSFAALPKTMYRAGTKFARVEDPPDTRQQIYKLTIIAEPDAYSVNLMDKKGTHAIDQGGENDLHLPIVRPFDPNRRLGKLDRLEFGDEFEFFEAAGATKQAGPLINDKPTSLYEFKTPQGSAKLITRGDTETPVLLRWETKDGTYTYEYITYEDLPFDPGLFARPKDIQYREVKPLAPGEN